MPVPLLFQSDDAHESTDVSIYIQGSFSMSLIVFPFFPLRAKASAHIKSKANKMTRMEENV